MIHQNEALDQSFSKKLISRSEKVNKGQKSRKRPQKVKFWFLSKVYKLYLKMKLLARAFQKRSLNLVLRSNKVNKGQKRAEKRSNFKLHKKLTNYTSKWSSWRKLSRKIDLVVKKSHHRSSKAIKGHQKLQKSQNRSNFIFFKRRQIIP